MSSPGSRAGLSAIVAISAVALPMAASCGSTIDEQSAHSSSGTAAGTGGASSSGGGGGEGCVPGTLLECYSGPAETEGVGVCHGGAKKCDPDGMSFGACQWEVTPSAEDCKTPDDEDCDAQSPACPGQTVWSKSFAGVGNEYSQRVAVDPSGNLIVVGGFDGTLTLGALKLTAAGKNDFFVAKFNASGEPVWVRGFGSVGEDYATDVAADAQGNIVLTGSVGGNVDLGDGPLAGFGEDDIFILKLDPQGEFLWRKMFGSAMSDVGYGVAVDSAGNVVATGSFNGTIDFGTGSLTAAAADIYVAKLAPSGAPLWVKQLGGMYDDYGAGVAALAGGDMLVIGGFYGPVNFGTGQLVTVGGYDGFLVRLDSAGKTTWATHLKGSPGMANYPIISSVAADGSGAAVVSGYFKGKVDLGGGVLTSAGGTDAFVAKYDGAAGKHVFSQRFGGSYVYPGQPDNVTDGAFAVATDAAGNIALTGSYIDTIDLGGGPLGKQVYGDMFFARFDPTGKHIVSKNYGTAVSYAVGTGVAVTASGNAVLTGYFVGTIDFGKGALSTANSQEADIFLAELAP